jgi:AbrB family looped-hinge helix DNA binding protein
MHKVGPKGTVVIEKDIRKALDLQPGTEVYQSVVGNSILLTPFKSTPPGSACGILKDAIAHLDPDTRARLATSDGLEAAINEAWTAHVQEHYGSNAAESAE